jgi:hypothetical protein
MYKMLNLTVLANENGSLELKWTLGADPCGDNEPPPRRRMTFRASRKAHPAFVVADLDELAGEMDAAGSPARWSDGLAPRRRFYGEDPFGNRLGFLGP